MMRRSVLVLMSVMLAEHENQIEWRRRQADTLGISKLMRHRLMVSTIIWPNPGGRESRQTPAAPQPAGYRSVSRRDTARKFRSLRGHPPGRKRRTRFNGRPARSGMGDGLARLNQGFGVVPHAIQPTREHRGIQGAPAEHAPFQAASKVREPSLAG